MFETTARFQFGADLPGNGVRSGFGPCHLACRSVACAYSFVIDPEQCCGGHAHSSDDPPDPFRLVLDLSKVMEKRPAEPAADERSDPNREKGEPHVCALLA